MAKPVPALCAPLAIVWLQAWTAQARDTQARGRDTTSMSKPLGDEIHVC